MLELIVILILLLWLLGGFGPFAAPLGSAVHLLLVVVVVLVLVRLLGLA